MKTSINMQLLITVVHHKIYNQSKKILITTCRKVNISVGGKSVHAEEGIHVRINKVNKNTSLKTSLFPNDLAETSCIIPMQTNTFSVFIYLPVNSRFFFYCTCSASRPNYRIQEAFRNNNEINK